ncbi:MAG TPA: LytR family transcriptional regulator, partial [Actinotalea sp.]|nr:LytR family transcriptional regulator [Actinotalea sp.]
LTANPELGNIPALAGLAFSLRTIPSGNITFMTIPFGAYAPDPNQVQWTSEAAPIWANIAADLPIVTPTPVAEPTVDPATGETIAPTVPVETPQPGVDPFTPDDVTSVCG